MSGTPFDVSQPNNRSKKRLEDFPQNPIGKLVRETFALSRGLTTPTLQGSSQIRRIRQQGASLQPGEGFGALGSIQAGEDPNAFNNLLMQLLRNPNTLRGL